MYVNEPSELALLPELKEEIDFEEPRDYHEFFWDDQPGDPGKYAAWHRGIHTQVCRFDPEGNHVTMARDCPHFELEDEEGKRIQEGWTVQWQNT